MYALMPCSRTSNSLKNLIFFHTQRSAKLISNLQDSSSSKSLTTYLATVMYSNAIVSRKSSLLKYASKELSSFKMSDTPCFSNSLLIFDKQKSMLQFDRRISAYYHHILAKHFFCIKNSTKAKKLQLQYYQSHIKIYSTNSQIS